MNLTQFVIDRVFDILVTQYNHDKNILYNVLESVNASIFQVLVDAMPPLPSALPLAPPSSTQVTPVTEPVVKKPVIPESVIGGCRYVFKRGKMTNKACNSIVKTGMVVCSTHAKHNDKYKLETVPLPLVKKEKKKIDTNTSIKNSIIYNNTDNDKQECHNLDEMQVPEINKLYQDIFKTSHINLSSTDKYKFDLPSEEIFLEKKKTIINHCIENNIKVKATLTKLGQLDFNQNNLVTIRHPKGAILKFVKYKQSKYWIDYTTRLIFKSPEELIVMGRINRYEQPLLAIDGAAFDLILQYQFEYDETLLSENGKQAQKAFEDSLARHAQMKEAEKMLAEPSIQGNDIIL
jgi:hypothetical protein